MISSLRSDCCSPTCKIVCISYTVWCPATVRCRLELCPAVNFRMHEAPPDAPVGDNYSITLLSGNRYEISSGGSLRLCALPFMVRVRLSMWTQRTIQPIVFWMEERRGYNSKGNLWSPGHFHLDLQKNQDAALVASTHSWETMLALKPEEAFRAEKQRRRHLISLAHPAARTGRAAELVLAVRSIRD